MRGAQDVSASIWSLAKLYHHPSSELLNNAAVYTFRNWARFKPLELAKMLWALATLRGCQPKTWTQLLEKLATEPVAKFGEEELVLLYSTFMLLQGASASLAFPLREGAPPPLPVPRARVFGRGWVL